MPPDGVEVGAPNFPADLKRESRQDTKPYIVLSSEAYEVAGGRALDFYQDILPPLADLVLSEGRVLIIKLHPSESHAERRQVMAQILRPEQLRVTRMVGGKRQTYMLNTPLCGSSSLST